MLSPVVLGGDTPLGISLILDLEKNGYIVITSVSTPEAVEEIEQKSHGYVRAFVLDPYEVRTTELIIVRSCLTVYFLARNDSLFLSLSIVHNESSFPTVDYW